MTEKIQQKTIQKKELIITGFGGQGIVLIGAIIGKAAALGDRQESTLIQSYGPESRGGACSAQIIIADKKIHYPYVRKPDILVCMSQAGYDKFIGNIDKGTTLLTDQDLVDSSNFPFDCFSIPATRFAEELGRTMVANVIMLGFLSAITGAVSIKSLEHTVPESVPLDTVELNLSALKKGWHFGIATLKGRAKKAAGKIGVEN